MKKDEESKCPGQILSNLPSEKVPDKERTSEDNESMNENGTSVKTELSYDNVMRVLKDLYLTSVELGDYLVVMSAIEDATIDGEPYIALQLWLNMKSGKVIKRIWGQTVAHTIVADINHFKDVCSKHFCDPPCLGYLVKEDELGQKMQGFVISQTPVLRKISMRCQKVVVNDSRAELQACKNCLKLMNQESWEEDTTNLQESDIKLKQENKGPQQKEFYKQGHIAPESEEDLDSMIHNNEDSFESKTSLLHGQECQEPMLQMPSFSEGMLHIENEHHHENDLTCHECGKTFSRIQNLEEHKKYVHSHKGTICSICGKTFNNSQWTKRNLELHWKKFHPNFDLPKYIKDLVLHGQKKNTKNRREVGPLDVKCELCGAIRTTASFQGHLKGAHGVTETYKKNCFWCGKTLSVHNLRNHARQHHFWGDFSCTVSQCSFRGNVAAELAGHINDFHKGDADAECPLCKKGCTVNDIETHYRECVQMKNHRCCETCGKEFKAPKEYRSHKLIHLREKAEKGDLSIDKASLYFHCDKCDTRFVSKAGLQGHVRNFHEERSEDSKFPCPSCGLVYDTKAKLKYHDNLAHSTDEKYQCKICGRRCGSTSDLKVHKRIHEDRQFKCKYCPKILKSANNLKFHERYHTGEKPFVCSICGSGFVAKEKLQQHSAGVHKIAGPKGRATGWKRSKSKKDNCS